ncbi:MAG: phosphatidate cytidylyltransferase [bacterium]
MLTRVITASLMAPILLACVYFGGVPFLALILILALLSLNEFYGLMRRKDFHPAFWVGNFFTIFFIVLGYFALKKDWEPAQAAILTVSAVVTMIATLFLKERPKEAIVDIAVTLMGMIYIGWFYSYFLFIRALSDKGAYLIFMMMTVWALDVVAYFAGKAFGRHKLWPSVSPKKSVEGAIAGFIFALVAAYIFGYYADFSTVHSLILGGIIGIVAQFSDLVESLIKRDAGVKDASDLVPGHGGILDRMDSFIFTAPVVYYYLVWILLR